MNLDDTKIEDAVLALLAVFSFDNGWSWKNFDFDVMDRLHQKGFIFDPKRRTKSVGLTDEGLARGLEIARVLFAKKAG